MALWRGISGGRVELSEANEVLRRLRGPRQRLSSAVRGVCAGFGGGVVVSSLAVLIPRAHPTH